MGVPAAGSWKEIFNSDAGRFGGSGKVNPRALRSRAGEVNGRENSISPSLPPLAGVIFKRTSPRGASAKAAKGAAKAKPAAKKQKKAAAPKKRKS